MSVHRRLVQYFVDVGDLSLLYMLLYGADELPQVTVPTVVEEDALHT